MEQGSQTKALLLVEDDAIYAQFILSALRKSALPLRLNHCTDVDQALAYLRAEPPYSDRAAHPMPDIVLLDVTLGASSGFPVLHWLQENGHLQNEKIRVVILSSSSRTEHLQEALRFGAISYLVKSPTAENVIGLLAKWLPLPSFPTPGGASGVQAPSTSPPTK